MLILDEKQCPALFNYIKRNNSSTTILPIIAKIKIESVSGVGFNVCQKFSIWRRWAKNKNTMQRGGGGGIKNRNCTFLGAILAARHGV
jgi:hypothetical protein